MRAVPLTTVPLTSSAPPWEAACVLADMCCEIARVLCVAASVRFAMARAPLANMRDEEHNDAGAIPRVVLSDKITAVRGCRLPVAGGQRVALFPAETRASKLPCASAPYGNCNSLIHPTTKLVRPPLPFRSLVLARTGIRHRKTTNTIPRVCDIARCHRHRCYLPWAHASCILDISVLFDSSAT